MSSLRLPSFLFLLVCTALSLPTHVVGSEQLTILSPNLFPTTQGVIYQKPSLFGLPNFREKIVGQVIYPARGTNNYGCLPYASFIPPDQPGGAAPTLIVMIDRGNNCTFASKVQHAQDAGASGVIIVNDDAIYGGSFLPYMGAGPEGNSINIPAMLIFGRDGDVIKGSIDGDGGVQVSMAYFLPNPDDRVEFDLFTTANDPLSKTFEQQFRQVVTSMGEHVLFEPHYQYHNYYINSYGFYASCKVPYWVSGGCTEANLNTRCGKNCLNCGRYCQLDPDGTGTATGGDVVLEQLRQKCVWQYGNDTSPTMNTYWFDYVNGHEKACAGAPSQYDASCGNALIASLNIPASYITTCMNVTGLTQDSSVPILDKEVSWMNMFGQLPPPELYVNQQPYHGALACSDPIGTNCPPLQMICAGFATGTAPSACFTSSGCPLGQLYDACDVCGGDNSTCTGCDGVVKSGKVTDACGDCLLRSDPAFTEDKEACPAADSSTKPFPVGIVIGVVLAAVILIGLGVWFYLRRQNEKMKDDIDSLLKQYLPMSEDGTHGGLERPNRRIDQSRLLAQEGETEAAQNQL